MNAGALEVVEYLIERFVHDSWAMGMTPVCVPLYSTADLRVIKAGIRLDAQLLEFLAERGMPSWIRRRPSWISIATTMALRGCVPPKAT